ncbi:1-deoxy-D-xylulose-5-phosphate synthase [Curtanaerobium respiraculi]|uniref:1-deoxy-D-xylulose-5-phosphate synthase n=1 Tax=Curtanaerobium respiraculi TaxID=2949669 RepID=UPI0024B364AB|nr:1-deoxy-D-xylulose-5-phosphate synthase [Curtanaerobium respiraculi]
MDKPKRILDRINSPQDLHALPLGDLSRLCNEIRQEIISTTSTNGGHLAPSLGAVEIIVALHSILNCPEDKIVFDVGHQAYAHKLLTGRRDRFRTLRQIDGITGFPNPSESPYDVHPSGHASDSLSVAMGLARARDLDGKKNNIVAVIGDAALSGGMAFEALNHIGQEQARMVIVLNDNGMSISRPVGALVQHLGYMRMSSQYRRTRDTMQEAMEHSGPLTQAMLDFGRNMKESMKQFVVPDTMVFEQLDITCTAPVNGHDLAQLREVLRMSLQSDGPVLVHVMTRKGNGYPPAQSNPELYHGVGPFDVAKGELIKNPAAKPKYTSVFGDALMKEASKDKAIIAITAAMKDGTGLAPFSKRFPKRFIDTGITEEHAVALSSGLAAGGKKPVVCIYSTFLQRAIDQIDIDCALARRHVVFAVDRAGLVGDDGPTHHGTLDMVYLRMIPGMRAMAPSDEAELVAALHTALKMDGPVALRYPRGEGVGAKLPPKHETWDVGRSRVVREGEDVAILAWGRMVQNALGAADILAEQGIQARVVDMRWVKPIDAEAVRAAADTKLMVTVEEGVVRGGVGEAALGELARSGLAVPALVLGIPDAFIEQGDVEILFERLGLDAEGIADSVLARLQAAVRKPDGRVS